MNRFLDAVNNAIARRASGTYRVVGDDVDARGDASQLRFVVISGDMRVLGGHGRRSRAALSSDAGPMAAHIAIIAIAHRS